MIMEWYCKEFLEALNGFVSLSGKWHCTVTQQQGKQL
jgi:hypothetical protein